MKSRLFKKFILLNAVFIFMLPFFNLDIVHADNTFTMCTLSENSYLRADAGSDIKLTDVDNATIVLSYPMHLEVLDSKVVNGKEYKKLKANYYSNNYEGWIYSGYLKDFKTYTIDSNYGDELRKAGFPESYILPLQKLHAIHPTWNFIPSKLGDGLDFNTVISEEYNPVYKNLISGPNETLRSTDGASYNSGAYKQFEPGWYAPSKQTIAFYMDPRNWLTENTVFMFEQLSYNSNFHTENAVQPILNGTFMAGSYLYDGQTLTYANTFVQAGVQKNVSPVHLASRVIQEQGSTGNSGTINMQSDGLTYYNFFNINATGSTTATIISNALATAKANGWTSPYTSIIGGASTISNGYINAGQDTIYYQKFNTINTGSLYSHQYMANVRALPAEAYSIYKSYFNSGIIDSPFTFKIPVYINMPGETTLSLSGNADNTLKSLSISNCNLNPEFNSAATNYTCNVSSITNQVTINAVRTSSLSSIKGDGVIVLNSNSTTVDIVVTAANGESKTYTIVINKVEQGKESPSDIISYIGFNNSNNIISGITLGTDSANLIADVKNKFNLASITIKDKNGNIKTNGAIATGNTMTITNNNQTVTFTSVVTGDINGDGKISIADLALVKSSLLKTSSLNGVYNTAADVNKDGKISIADLALIKSHLLGTTIISK